MKDITYIVIPQLIRSDRPNLCFEYVYGRWDFKSPSLAGAKAILKFQRKKQYRGRIVAIACCIDGTTITRNAVMEGYGS